MGTVGVDGPVHWVFTDATDGDLAPRLGTEVDARRTAVVPDSWTWLRQEHGAAVVVVDRPGHNAGAEADAAVTVQAGAPIAVAVADCAPVLLIGDGAVAVVHVGWRGLVAGVVAKAAEAMALLGGSPRRAVLGPCIRPRCYEFGADDLDTVADAYGDAVRSRTAWGTPALDLAAGVTAAVDRCGATVQDAGLCTACSPVHYSHRARRDAGRQVLVAWLEE